MVKRSSFLSLLDNSEEVTKNTKTTVAAESPPKPREMIPNNNADNAPSMVSQFKTNAMVTKRMDKKTATKKRVCSKPSENRRKTKTVAKKKKYI